MITYFDATFAALAGGTALTAMVAGHLAGRGIVAAAGAVLRAVRLARRRRAMAQLVPAWGARAVAP